MYYNLPKQVWQMIMFYLDSPSKVTFNFTCKIFKIITIKYLEKYIKYNLCHMIAENGHLEVLKWAHQNGCYWDKNTCCNAALNGHLEVLK